ncbi:MAG: pyridoxal phosphate-dependent aminotransferase family protein [Flavobacteriaceae bacterium]|nr:pyridoxal phosphate-dependent aminotransferase family protein [Flavobacteriaceae bacterium]
MELPKKLLNKLQKKKSANALRTLKVSKGLIDFSSNDYLGLASSEIIFDASHQYLRNKGLKNNGATGSRLLTGNSVVHEKTEAFLAKIHNSESAILFNSGYNANTGLLSAIGQRNDIILFDEFSHASIRDGIRLSHAKSFSFNHNNLADLQSKLERHADACSTSDHIYVITESVFSMDGDSPDLKSLAGLCKKFNAYLIVDEAHAVGVFGKGLVDELELEKEVFATIVTFGKAIGCHGAAVLCSDALKQYLINFSRPFIYSTAMSTHSLATIQMAYQLLFEKHEFAAKEQFLQENINHFRSEIDRLSLSQCFVESQSAIQSCIITGNDEVKKAASALNNKSYDVRPILSPTVPEGKERLRFCIHSFNTPEEITTVLEILSIFV